MTANIRNQHTVFVRCAACAESTATTEENRRHAMALGLSQLCCLCDPAYTGWLPAWARRQRAARQAVTVDAA